MEFSKKILLVDDDPDVIAVSEIILKNEGYEVLSANNSAEALEILENNIPDYMILDVMMDTQFEGFVLAKKIKQNPKYSQSKVFIQTSVDVLQTQENDVIKMAHEYRSTVSKEELNVILIQNPATGKAGVDYLDENNENVWVPVDGFIKKPVEAHKILSLLEQFA